MAKTAKEVTTTGLTEIVNKVVTNIEEGIDGILQKKFVCVVNKEDLEGLSSIIQRRVCQLLVKRYTVAGWNVDDSQKWINIALKQNDWEKLNET